MQLSERSATYLFNHVKIMIAYYREVGENRDVVTRVLIQVARFAHCVTTIQNFVSIVVMSILAVGLGED